MSDRMRPAAAATCPGKDTNADELKAVTRITHNTTYSPSAFKERNSSCFPFSCFLLPFSEAEKRISSSFQLKYRTSLRQTVGLTLKNKK